MKDNTTKILIIEAEYGGGHKSITEAVEEELRKQVKGTLEVQHYNFSHPLVAKGYQFTGVSSDLVYRLGFALTDRKILNRWEPGSMLNFYLKRGDLVAVLKDFQPDVVFINNQFASQRVPELVRKVLPVSKSVVFVADPFTPHAMTMNPQADLTLCATGVVMRRAKEFGVPEERLRLTGHPVRPAFYNLPKSKRQLQKKMGLKPGLFTIMLGGSGDGADKVKPIIDGLMAQSIYLPEFQAVVVCGGNKALEVDLKALKAPEGMRLQVRGFERDMPGVMHSADLVAGKAGPNLMLEAVAAKLPFVVTFYLNQEAGNVDYLRKHSLGFVATETDGAVELLARLISKPEELKQVRKHVLKERKTHRQAARKIAEEILSI